MTTSGRRRRSSEEVDIGAELLARVRNSPTILCAIGAKAAIGAAIFMGSQRTPGGRRVCLPSLAQFTRPLRKGQGGEGEVLVRPNLLPSRQLCQPPVQPPAAHPLPIDTGMDCGQRRDEMA